MARQKVAHGSGGRAKTQRAERGKGPLSSPDSRGYVWPWGHWFVPGLHDLKTRTALGTKIQKGAKNFPRTSSPRSLGMF